MRRRLSGTILGATVLVLVLVTQVPCQALREIFAVGMESGSAADHLFRGTRSELPPTVRVVIVEGDLAQHPWPSPLRSRGSIVIVANDSPSQAAAIPAHLPQIRLTASEQDHPTMLSVRVVPDATQTQAWIQEFTAGALPFAVLVSATSTAAPTSDRETITQDEFLDAALWKSRGSRIGGLILLGRELGSLPVARVLEVARERGLPVITDDRTAWALGASAALLPDLKSGGSLLGLLLKRMSEGLNCHGFQVPVTTMVRVAGIPKGLQAPALKSWRTADHLVLEQGP